MASRIVNDLEMPLQTVANVETLETEITLVASLGFVGALLVLDDLFAAGDVVVVGG